MLLLNKNWKFRDTNTQTWYPASVPGCIHTDLINNHIIEDPFYRDNENKYQWIDKQDWEYLITFSITPDMLQNQNMYLVFKGLDTFADVYLNNGLLLKTDNMFREWRVECKHLLKPGENELRVLFHSPINKVMPVLEKMKYVLPAANDTGEKTSPLTRKAPYHFGWDWGPRFVTSGIWRPVYLEMWDTAKIEHIHIVQNSLANDQATMTAIIDLTCSETANVKILIKDEMNRFSPQEKNLVLVPGANQTSIEFEIDNPQIWQPNGLGEQNIYILETSLTLNGIVLDTRYTKTGLRSLELRQEKDEKGKSFAFVINGTPVFARGGNWIPADIFLNRVTPDKYRYLLQSCKDANMNMLRVWGGGIYEEDVFYDLCDEMGIMIWQDFMFACSMYPGDEPFLESVKHEAEDNIKRLRNHPCIVLWCGNNEMEAGWKEWNWQNNYPERVWDDYLKIFHELLPRVCAQLDPSRPYWPSSPSSNGDAEGNDQNYGDIHYWGVWHAKEPFANYEKQRPRFISEYGFQSFPEMKTIKTFAIPEDYNIDSNVMRTHQKSGIGNRVIHEYMLDHFPEPKNFESLMYLSQILQAEGIKAGAEHYRRLMPWCMGSLYWQIDDCWQAASWSSIDYFGRWKALHYYAKKFYAPIMVSPNEKEDNINIYIVSDVHGTVPGELQISLFDLNGNTLFSDKQSISIQPLASKIYKSYPVIKLLSEYDSSKFFLQCDVIVNDDLISTNRHYFVPIKELALVKPNINTTIEKSGDRFTIKLSTNTYAKNVFLSLDDNEGSFSDNYFDLIPGKDTVIQFTPLSTISLDQVRDNLKMITFLDAF